MNGDGMSGGGVTSHISPPPRVSIFNPGPSLLVDTRDEDLVQYRP